MQQKAKRPKLERMRSPAGRAMFPRLTEPDTKFSTPDKNPFGTYSTGLILARGQADNDAFIDAIAARYAAAIDAARKSLYDDAIASGKTEKGATKVAADIKIADPPYQDEKDENEEPTGNVIFQFKLSAGGRKTDEKTGKMREWHDAPDLFDAKLQPIEPAKVRIGSGSTLVVNFEVNPFYTAGIGAGLSLRLRAVQVKKLVERAVLTGAQHGFSADESGWTIGEADSDSAPENPPMMGSGAMAAGNVEDDI